jgi:glycosyltransferase involved in cell wall biosynthesis
VQKWDGLQRLNMSKIKKKNITILSSFAPSLTIFRGDMIAAFIRNGYKVTCFSPEGQHVNAFNELRSIGVETYLYSLERTGTGILADLKTLIGLAKIFRKISNSFVISYTAKPVLYGSMISLFFPNITHLAMITGMPSILHRLSHYSLSRFVVKEVMRGNSKILFQNSDDEQFFAQNRYLHAGQSVRINGSGINLEKYKYYPPSSIAPVSFLLISRLLYQKGILEYIEAANQVSKTFSQASFSIVGWFDTGNPDGISQVDFFSLIKNSKVEYLGKHLDVRHVIRNHSVYVLPSYHEGMPRTVLEAMAIGRPIITTDVPGCRDTVEEGVNGFLVPQGESEAIAESMMRFINSPELIKPMGEASREFAERKYDVNLVNKKILAVLKS